MRAPLPTELNKQKYYPRGDVYGSETWDSPMGFSRPDVQANIDLAQQQANAATPMSPDQYSTWQFGAQPPSSNSVMEDIRRGTLPYEPGLVSGLGQGMTQAQLTQIHPLLQNMQENPYSHYGRQQWGAALETPGWDTPHGHDLFADTQQPTTLLNQGLGSLNPQNYYGGQYGF